MIVAAEAGAEHTAAKARCLANDGANSDISSEVSTACSSAATGHNFTGSQKVMGNASPQHRRTNSAPPSLADGNAAGSAGAGHDVGTLLLQAFQLRDDYMVLQEAAHAKICELQAQLQAAHAEVHISRSQCQAAHRQLSLQNGMRCAKLLRGFFSAWSRQCLKNQAERAAEKKSGSAAQTRKGLLFYMAAPASPDCGLLAGMGRHGSFDYGACGVRCGRAYRPPCRAQQSVRPAPALSRRKLNTSGQNSNTANTAIGCCSDRGWHCYRPTLTPMG
mmetsp:Transcript_135850/g.221046  ORF Transcript_135850/g.221046 Transcript_135850/m.221046 type:complete len:275 (-) Transcript_135850:445-1269(-)